MRLTDPVFDEAAARLSERLETGADRPVAVALSGGGDSIALLHIAAAWAREHGRRLLALTVDHGLNPDSAEWARLACAASETVGASWRGLDWKGAKPATGVSAAARLARHALIAEAAREAGARVVLFAHTADDVAEADLMRARGSTLGRLREWSPSPAWPQGRGVMLLRPMLRQRRADLRAWLADRHAGWIEDPANLDPRSARARARADLAEAEAEAEPVGPDNAWEGDPPRTLGWGAFAVDRGVEARALAAATVCAGGGDQPPRGDRLIRLVQRLRAGEDFSATLAGARIEAVGSQVLIAREAGEFSRHPPFCGELIPSEETVWDGRWALRVEEAGWRVAPAAGVQASLSRPDRDQIRTLPRALRGAAPVLIWNRPGARRGPVLAAGGPSARSLVEQRLSLALDQTTHESGL